VPFHNRIFIICWIQLNFVMKEIQFKLGWIQSSSNWFQFNSIQPNSTQISKRTLTMLNPKEKNIVFGSIHFNSNLNFWIQLSCIQFKLHYANSFNIRSFKWNLMFTKLTHFFHKIIVLVVHSNTKPKLPYTKISSTMHFEGNHLAILHESSYIFWWISTFKYLKHIILTHLKDFCAEFPKKIQI